METADLQNQINDELLRLEASNVLSSKSTTKYDNLRILIGNALSLNPEEIYISTIDKAANSNARMQQMQIRSDVRWKVFVGICTRNDVLASKTYMSQTERNLNSGASASLEGTIWMSRSEANSGNSWKVVRAIFSNSSSLPSQISKLWPKAKVETIGVSKKTSNTEPEPSRNSEKLSSTELQHLPLAKIRKALNLNGQIILAGPPGTGKSYAAREIAAALVGASSSTDTSRLSFVQFHPNFEYEDFIEGYVPVKSNDGNFQLELRPGILMRLVDELNEEPNELRVLIIDEINRANLAKVFGEFLFLIEYRETEIELRSGTQFSIPRNMFVIATMNTTDRNIRSIDIALRRRFRIFELEPSIEALRHFYDKRESDNLIGESLFRGLQALNQDLVRDIDRHHTVGHTFFMQKTLDAAELREIWDYQVHPLIEEYFFDRPDIADSYTFEKYFPET